MKCSDCGNDLPDSSIFCFNCKKDLTEFQKLYSEAQQNNKKGGIGCLSIIGIVLILGLLGSIFNSITKSKKKDKQEFEIDTKSKDYSPNTKTSDDPKKEESYTFELLGTDHNQTVQNYYVLIKTNNYSKESIEAILLEIKEKICSRSCNISAYDDKKYYELDRQMELETRELGLKVGSEIDAEQEKAEDELIEKKYYVVVADHFIGSIDGNFDYYPYRDWRYKELGGKH